MSGPPGSLGVRAHEAYAHADQDTARFEALRQERDDRWATALRESARPMGDGQAAQAAFAEFYSQSASLALSVARRVVGERFACDVMADAYAQAWRDVAKFEPDRGPASAWLLTIVRSRALDRLRSEKLRLVQPIEDSSADLQDDTPGPDSVLAHTEAKGLLHRALADLSANERWVLGLAYYKDMSHSEIAAATALPLGTVKSLTSRALAKLNKALPQLAHA